MEYAVPLASIVGMYCTLAVAFGVPVGLVVWWEKKTQASMRSLLVGCMIFIVFALVLEQAFHSIVLSLTGTFISDNVILLALYGGLCAGLFEETGRYIAMKGLLKNQLTKENGIMYGMGHGGIESILLIGVSYISNIALSRAVNHHNLPAALDLNDPQIFESVSALWTTKPWMFYMAGVERMIAVGLQITLSYIIYKAVKEKNRKKYWIAVAIHMAVDTGSLLLNQVVPAYVTELVLMVACVVMVKWLVKAYQSENEDITEITERVEIADDIQ